MTDYINELYFEGLISELDIEFANRVSDIYKADDTIVKILLALASKAATEGDVCVELDKLPKLKTEKSALYEWPDISTIKDILNESNLCSDGTKITPLVLDSNNRLYLYRYWNYQKRVVDNILERISTKKNNIIDDEKSDLTNYKSALNSGFVVVSGGPGTGKTTLVAKLLIEILKNNKSAKIVAVAPTGKAAVRLQESLDKTKSELAGKISEEILHLLPQNVITISRALGASVRFPSRVRYNKDVPLIADVLVADEASMIDLPMMSKLLEAVPSASTVILLGDKDQLASIEAGRVFSDICKGADNEGSPAGSQALLKSIITLNHSYRFGDDSGIGRLARAVNGGDDDTVMEILKSDRFADLDFIEPEIINDNVDSAELSIAKQAAEISSRVYSGYLGEELPEQKLSVFDKMMVLSPVRKGLTGVENLNILIENELEKEGAIKKDRDYYNGRLIMVTQNSYKNGLFNGDTGIVDKNPDETEDENCIYFKNGLKDIVKVNKRAVENCETACAITIHKSQGSEYEHAVVVLPLKYSPILTRELFYTAITRAKTKVTIIAGENIIRKSVLSKITRTSGLGDALWNS